MQYRRFGSTDRLVSAVGQGTWPLPDVTALRRGIELGMTHIDTAEMYGDGRSEELVGRAIRGYARDDLFLVSKVLPSNGTPSRIERSCDASLRRLGIDAFDCYLLHWRSSEVDLAETMQGLERLLKAGKTRSIGVSNLDPWDAREAAGALLDARIACNQVLYNLAERTVEEHELPWVEMQDAALVAYTPLGGIPSDSSGALSAIAAQRGVSVQTVALAFLLRNERVFVIPKAAQIAHVEANALAAELQLDDDEIAALEAAFPRVRRAGPLPMN